MVDTAAIESLTRQLLVAIGEDPHREGIADTPARVARWWSEFLDNRRVQDGKLNTTFGGLGVDQLVVVRNIEAWSLCEHHLLPFKINVTVGYLTTTKVLGLSKFARIVQKVSAGLQIQERLVHQVADEITKLTESPHVAVLASGQHLCMRMRGARSNADMLTSVLRGRFLDDPSARIEFMRMAEPAKQ
ncbi:GTP cyclohydrolase I [uncultured Caudovirales phage]|uniref:GTP cyclohydrolase I n=1 Tax=uncultured Caudovirales phage TaxID=2100421 RepID=A0A6J5L7M7_9CAUD|nr:GTP cyclohydrolase I [uncultured Caudovirales phage]